MGTRRQGWHSHRVPVVIGGTQPRKSALTGPSEVSSTVRVDTPEVDPTSLQWNGPRGPPRGD